MKFSLLSCDWIGFDLDHTLIRYRLSELHRLIYDLMCEYLYEQSGYPEELVKVDYDTEFGVKALIYDSLHGNLIQLDSNGFVHTAFHGVNVRLSKKTIDEIYPNAFESIEEDVTKRFLCIFTYFEHSVSYLIARLVDLIDAERISQVNEKNYRFFLSDLFAGFDFLFGDMNRGKYFSTIRDNLSKFVYRRDEVRLWMEKLRSSGKKLFLATNSRFDYTDLLSRFAFGDDWTTLFDLIVVDCKKPSFFAEETDENRRAFLEMIEENVFRPVSVEEMRQNRIYSSGNSADLTKFMKRISEGDCLVIYFGDHIKSDIRALKQRTDWLAAVVLEELEFDSPPIIVHKTIHHQIESRSSYETVRRSKYFSSFFSSPVDSIIFDERNSDETLADLELPSICSSYWYGYITKHAHFSLSCLSVLAKDFALNHSFENEPGTEHFVILNKN